MNNVPAWVERMEKADDKHGYHCSGFEANGIANEWWQLTSKIKQLWKEIERLREGMTRLAEIAYDEPNNYPAWLTDEYPWIESE